MKAWLRQLLVVRRFEEHLIKFHADGHISGHYHVCIGQEGTALGVLEHARPDDVIYTTHRNHGHLLIRGAEPEPLFAEILGKATGYCGGRAGTLHLSKPDLGIPWSSALVGGNVPQALGAAYALKKTRPGSVVVCFFGDGTFEEGAVFEALNVAAVMRVPILFICENNASAADHGAAGAFPTSSSGAAQLSDLSAAFQIPSQTIDGIDPWTVSEIVEGLIQEVRETTSPRFIETKSVRWPGSRLVWPYLPGGGMFEIEWLTGEADPPDEVADWTRVGDPIKVLYQRMVETEGLSADELRAIDTEVADEVAAAARRALDAPFPEPEAALEGVF